MYEGIFEDRSKKYDFNLVIEKMRQLLHRERVKTADFELDESNYYDGLAVSYTENYPILNIPIYYRIHYDSFHGEDSCFSASVGVPEGIIEISDMECREIASECGTNSGMMISFEGRNNDSRYIGIFHLINSVYGRHVLDLDEMQHHLHGVRCVVTEIAHKLFEKNSNLYLTGQCDAHTSIAEFEQSNSLFDDDRMIMERDYFKELCYDPHDPVNLEDTIEITDLLYPAESHTDRV